MGLGQVGTRQGHLGGGAIPRKKYPSDHRRWFRVAEDILDDPKLNGEEWVWGAYIRTLAMLNRTKSKDGILRVSSRQLGVMMGRSRADVAAKRLASAAHLGLFTAARYADYWLIFVSKWAEHQGFTPTELRSDSVQTPSTTPTPTPTPKTTPNKEPAASAAPISTWALECSNLLIELLIPVPGAVIPLRAKSSWAKEIERLVREAPELAALENPHEHIEGAIRWALGSENLGQQFEVVIRSGRALREKWPKLRAAANRTEAARVPSEAEFAADLYTRVQGSAGDG